MSCSSTQFMPLYPSGPSLYSWPSPSFHCFQFSLFSQSQPPLFFSHISDPSCLPIHLPLCQFLRPPKLNFPPLNPPTLFLSPLVTFMCWGPYFIRPPPGMWIRQLSPPYEWGMRKRSCTVPHPILTSSSCPQLSPRQLKAQPQEMLLSSPPETQMLCRDGACTWGHCQGWKMASEEDILRRFELSKDPQVSTSNLCKMQISRGLASLERFSEGWKRAIFLW